MSNHRAVLLAIGLTMCITGGCSMCCGTYDYTYPTYGGKYQRMDPIYGRAGSIYSDPSADPGVPALTNTQVPQQPRTSPDDDLDEELNEGLEEMNDDSSITGFGNLPNNGNKRGNGWR